MPEPMTPPDCDLRDFAFMPLDVARLRDSDLAAEASGDEFRAAVLLWCAAWHQVPAGSLPNDEKVIAHLAGYGRAPREWKKVKAGALRGFVECSDGRLYHPHVASKALEAWESREKFAEKRKRDRERLRNWRERKHARSADETHGETRFNAAGNADETLRTGDRGQGTVVPFDKSNGANGFREETDQADSDKRFWDSAKAYLGKGKASLIGKWVAEYGKVETAEAITRAQLERPVDPIAFIVGILRKSGSGQWEYAGGPC